MRGRIPEATLTELRERADIFEVVSAHVGLRKVGRNHVGLCPFHAEKTPSFTVNGERGIFHCFGCGAGGNVFTFLMRMESLPFPEVVERLARQYGVNVPERGEESGALRDRENLFRLNEQAARFFQRYLREAGEARVARDYLTERGIGGGVADRFMLGFAPSAGDVLVRRLRAAGQVLESAVRLGLVGGRSSGGGGHYDHFRARLMFPITDSSGRVIGFGSRSMPGTASAGGGLPKYLNSPETPLYRKGANLYGLAAARDAIRGADRVLVVEGYFDVLALAEAGISYAVATLGTALTLTQLQVLRRFTRNVVAFFDADAAGEKAAERSLPTFLEAGLWGHAAFLPAGDDPDTFVRRAGREAALAILAEAIPLLDFYLDRAVPPGSTPGERARVAQQVSQWLRLIADPFEYDITVRCAAERLGLTEELLRRQPTRAGVPANQPASARAPGPEPLLVEIMLSDPAAAARVAEVNGVALFEDERLRAIAEEIVAALQSGVAVDSVAILSRLDETLAARITGRLLDESGERPKAAAVVEGCLAALARRACRRRRQIVLRQIREAETRGNREAVEQGLRELQELRREVHT